ncbi:MAG: hypothetical protein ACR2I2_23965 [Bryobacteraceae bacterium]
MEDAQESASMSFMKIDLLDLHSFAADFSIRLVELWEEGYEITLINRKTSIIRTLRKSESGRFVVD